MTDATDDREFTRQVDVMLDVGYPALAGMSTEDFRALLAPLRALVGGDGERAMGDGRATEQADRMRWLIVVTEELVPARLVVPLLRLTRGDRPGVVDRNFGEEDLGDYRPLPWLSVPDVPAYLVLDVDRGDEFRGVRPREAVPRIVERGRTPLTIHEGLAFALQNPASLERNRCYMLAGSRAGHKRVPALWISENAPKLGWCWEGNLHTWLGIASAGGRQAPVSQSGAVGPDG